MSLIFDSLDQNYQQIPSKLNRSGFAMPQCDNLSDEAYFEPNLVSEHQSKHSVNPPFVIRGKCLNLDFSGNNSDLSKTKPYTWGNGGLMVMYYITKMIKQLKNLSPQIKFKSLNDAASDSKVLLQQTNKTQLFISYIQKILNWIPVIDPDSIFKMLWKIFMLILIIVNIFYLPLKIGFNLTNEGLFSQIFFETLPSWIFIIDIILNFLSAYYYKGQIHREKEEIVRNYAKTTLWQDLFFAFSFILSSYNVPYTEYILLLRVTKVKTMIEQIEEILNPPVVILTIIELFKSVFQVIFVSHFCACLWSLIGQMEIDASQNSWLDHKNIQDAPWQSKYLHALYFSTITTLTVGYGDIVPVSDAELVFVILMAMVICGLFGYTISSIGNILRQLTEKDQIFKSQMMFINNYLKKKQVNKQLMLQVRKYFEYYLRMKQEDNLFGEEMMQNLNKKLKEQISIDLYLKMLLKSRLIKNTLSYQNVEKLCYLVKEKKYAPEEIIQSQNEQADKLIFLLKGEVDLICEYGKKETKLTTITQEKFIGEREFIVSARYDYTIRTTKFSLVAYINYEDFMKIIKEDSQEEENYSMLRDQMLFNEEKQNYGEICQICKWTHQFRQCPLVFVQVNLNKIKRQFMITENHQRTAQNRFKKRKVNFDLNQIQEAAICNIINNNLMPVEDLTDQYLDQLGFLWQQQKNVSIMKTLISMKSIQTQNNGSSESSEEEKSKISKKKKTQDLKKVQFLQLIPENNGENPSKQPIQQTALKKRQSFAGIQQIQQRRISNVSLLGSDLNGLSQQFHSQTSNIQRPKINKNNSNSFSQYDSSFIKNKSISKSDLSKTSNFTSNQEEENFFNSWSQISCSQQRVDFDIDKCFTSKAYFSQGNIEAVLMKVKQPRRTQREVQIQNIMQKSKFKHLTNQPQDGVF